MIAIIGSVDTFLTFTLNGEEVFKSKTNKNSLNPVFNDNNKFEAMIVSLKQIEQIEKIFFFLVNNNNNDYLLTGYFILTIVLFLIIEFTY